MFLWLVANLKQGVIYFIKQALPPNKSAGSVLPLLIIAIPIYVLLKYELYTTFFSVRKIGFWR